MNRHTPSFFVSILVHIFFAALVFATVKYVVHIGKKVEKNNEKKICIKLQCVVHNKEKIKKTELKKVVTQKKIPVAKKRVPKKVIKKHHKKPHKKTPKKVPLKKKPLEKPVEKQVKEIKEELVQEVPSVVAPAPSPAPVPQVSTEELYLEKHLEAIIKLLSENLYYPRSARKRGIEGVVKVSFTLDTQARVSDIKIVSSQSAILSRAAVQTLENLSGEFPKPDEELHLLVPINYSLH